MRGGVLVQSMADRPHEPATAPDRGARPAARWRHALTPAPRAGAFYVKAWQRYLASEGEEAVPVVRPTLALAGHALLDEMILAGFKMLGHRRSPPGFARIEEETRAAVALYEREGWFAHPDGFFPAPPPLEHPAIHPARFRDLPYERWSFESGYEPGADEPGRERWLSYLANRRARVAVLRHGEPRPWLVCIHGAQMGRGTMDLTMFRARWLHEDLGLNVALPVLPLHGPRRRDVSASTSFPGDDVLDTVHGTAQSVWDVRRVVGWIREQGPSPVGVTGISLGGYLSALLASVDGDLACAILGVPAVDLVSLIEHHSPRPLDPAHARALELASTLNRVVSPLALEPKVPFDRRYVYAGLADRLAHPRHQVVRLWEHWGRPRVTWYEGGHTGFFRSKTVGRFVVEALGRSGMLGTTGEEDS